MAVLLDEKYLIEQTDDNKDYIFKRIKEQIAKNKKKYPNWRERPHILREGLPKPFLYGNEIVQIKNVSAFGRGEKNIQLSRQTGAKKIREALLRAMTDKTGAAAKTAYGRGARKLFANQEDHHILFRTLLDNFYRDLPEDQAAELTAHLARRGSPVGNVIENLQGLDIDLHDSKMPGSLHQWARDMNIDSKSFPDLSNLDFDARTAALDDWLDLIEEPLLDRTATILSRQDYRRYGTKGLPKTLSGKDRPTSIAKKDWLEFLYNQRENVKARANLLDKYPILAEDLDSPNIRPELKAKYEKALSLVPEGDVQTFKALTKAQEIQAIDWVNDPDIRKLAGKPTGEVTELGRRLGGIGDTISTKANLFKDYTSNIIKKSGAVIQPFKPLAKKGTKYVLPVAGLVLSNMNRSAISAEYEENPTNINLARKKISEAQVGLETADTATLGATGLVTWIPNLMGDAAEYILRTVQTPQTKEESDKEIDQLGDKFYTF